MMKATLSSLGLRKNQDPNISRTKKSIFIMKPLSKSKQMKEKLVLRLSSEPRSSGNSRGSEVVHLN